MGDLLYFRNEAIVQYILWTWPLKHTEMIAVYWAKKLTLKNKYLNLVFKILLIIQIPFITLKRFLFGCK